MSVPIKGEVMSIEMRAGDHIPWVYTRGIYGDPLFSQYEGKMLLVIFGLDTPELTDMCQRLGDLGEDFAWFTASWGSYEWEKIEPYHRMHHSGQAFIFSRNGNLMYVLNDGENFDSQEGTLREIFKSPQERRHIGNEWHYPDWRGSGAGGYRKGDRPLTRDHLYPEPADDHAVTYEALLQAILDYVCAAMFEMGDDLRESFLTDTLESLNILHDRGSHLQYWND